MSGSIVSSLTVMLKSLDTSLLTDSDLCVSVVNLDGSDVVVAPAGDSVVTDDGDTTGGSGATGVNEDSLR